MQNFFACQHRKQKSPTESLYGQTKESTILHKATSKQEPSLACNLFQNTARFCFQDMYFFSTNKDFMFYFPIQENGHLSASSPLFSLSLSLLRTFQQWRHLEALVSDQGKPPQFFPSVQERKTLRIIGTHTHTTTPKLPTAFRDFKTRE